MGTHLFSQGYFCLASIYSVPDHSLALRMQQLKYFFKVLAFVEFITQRDQGNKTNIYINSKHIQKGMPYGRAELGGGQLEGYSF